MSKVDVWMPWYLMDYLKDTMALSILEDCVYRRALDQAWIAGGRLPQDAGKLQNLLRVTPAEWKKSKWIFDKFFYKKGDAFGHKRVDAELAKARERSEVARENGKKGGRPKGLGEDPKKPSGLAVANPEHNPEHKLNETQTEPRDKAKPNPEKSSSPSPSDPPCSPPEEKPEFRKVFPAMCRAFGIDTPSHRDENEMFEAWLELQAKKCTIADLAARIAVYREKYPGYPVTRNAIFKLWHNLKPDEAPKKRLDRVALPSDDFLPDSLQVNATGPEYDAPQDDPFHG